MNKNSSGTILRWSTLLLLFSGGCQLPLANYLRDNLFPEETGAKIALSPILLPTYAVASVLDIAVVNPVRGVKNVPGVAERVWFWEDDPLWLGKGLLLPVKMVAIPAAAVGAVMFSEQFLYEGDGTDKSRSVKPGH